MILKSTNPYHYIFGEINENEGVVHIFGNRPLGEDEIEKIESDVQKAIDVEVEEITDKINSRILKRMLNGKESI